MSGKNNNLWIISDEKPIDRDISEITYGIDYESCHRFRISNYAMSLLSPDSFGIYDKLAGFYLTRKSSRTKLKEAIGKRRLISFLNRFIPDIKLAPEKYEQMLYVDLGDMPLSDKLTRLCSDINSNLVAFDPSVKALDKHRISDIEDIEGIVESDLDIEQVMSLWGSIANKKGFIASNLGKKILSVIPRMYDENGFFRINPDSLHPFDPEKYNDLYLINKAEGNEVFVAEKSPDSEAIEYPIVISNTNIVKHLHILEKNLELNKKVEDYLMEAYRDKSTVVNIGMMENDIKDHFAQDSVESIYDRLFSIQDTPEEIRQEVIGQLEGKIYEIVLMIGKREDDKFVRRLTNSKVHSIDGVEQLKGVDERIYMTVEKLDKDSSGRFYLLAEYDSIF